jgi:hypothetical protein
MARVVPSALTPKEHLIGAFADRGGSLQMHLGNRQVDPAGCSNADESDKLAKQALSTIKFTNKFD